jgi:tripartite-type tricarboxylate transporter receptor subunit TctC
MCRDMSRSSQSGHWHERTLPMRAGLAASLIAVTLALCGHVRADPVEDFYHGRNVTLIIGYSVGGGYDTYARVLARFIGRHIPGNPTIIAQNMAGAGSLRAANYLYNVAPKDGSAIGTFGRGLAMEPLIGTSATQYDARKFTWLGSGTNEPSICLTWHASPVKSWNDMLTTPFTVGGEGSGSDPDIYAALLKNEFGVKLRLVSGYPGTAEMALAIERGELDGRCAWSWSTLKALKPEWIAGRKINILVQMSLERNPELPDVPRIIEIATTDRQRQILKLVLSREVMGRPFAAPPGIPDDRRRALRQAFDDTMRDPEFLADAKARGLEVNPVSGADLDKLVEELYQTPPDVIAEAKAVIQQKAP